MGKTQIESREVDEYCGVRRALSGCGDERGLRSFERRELSDHLDEANNGDCFQVDQDFGTRLTESLPTQAETLDLRIERDQFTD